ncbi:MAG: PEP-CTERM sorting domain-containing protein [Terrimicrobiaceae bacterium]
MKNKHPHIVPAAITAILAAALAGLSTANATVIVDWGGSSITTASFNSFRNYTGGAITTGGSGTNPASGVFGGFSSGDPALISPSSNYTGGNFYGEVSFTRNPAWVAQDNSGLGADVENSTNPNRMVFKMGSATLNALVVWKQADFLNSLNTGNVGFDATSTVGININTLVEFNPGRVVIRLQGGSNDGYYISQSTPFNATGTKTASPTSLTWLAYDPATSLTTFGAVTNLLSGAQISHVTEVGFLFQSTGVLTSNAFRLDSFDVNAIAVPEPATWGLLAFSLTTVMVLRRRRARVA